MKTANVTIHGRKVSGYPSMNFSIEFETIPELIEKIDGAIEITDYSKVDVYIENEGQFSEEEMNTLENEWIIFN